MTYGELDREKLYGFGCRSGPFYHVARLRRDGDRVECVFHAAASPIGHLSGAVWSTSAGKLMARGTSAAAMWDRFAPESPPSDLPPCPCGWSPGTVAAVWPAAPLPSTGSRPNEPKRELRPPEFWERYARDPEWWKRKEKR